MDFKFDAPNSPSSTRRLNEIAQLADLLKQLRGDGRNISIEFTQTGVVVKFIGVQPIWVRLLTSPYTGSGPQAGSDCCSGSVGGSGSQECCPPGYGWEQVVPDGCGGWDAMAENTSGQDCNLPLYEINGLEVDLEIDGLPTVVQAWPDMRGQSYLFDGGGAGMGGGGGAGSTGICTYPEKIQVRSGQVCCNDENGFYETHWYEVYAQDGSCQKWVFASDQRADAIATHIAYGGSGAIEDGQECPTG